MIPGQEQRLKLQLGLLLGGVYGSLLSSSKTHLVSAGDWWIKWGLTGTTPYASFRYLWMKLMFNKCSPGCDTVFDLLSWLGGRSSCRKIWGKEPTLWTHSWLDIGQDSVCLPGPTPTLGHDDFWVWCQCQVGFSYSLCIKLSELTTLGKD